MKQKENPSTRLYNNYSRHYTTMESRGRGVRLPDDLAKLKRDRLPRWIDDISKTLRILDAGCAEGHLLEALRRVGFQNLTGIELSGQLISAARIRLENEVELIKNDICSYLADAPGESFDVVFFHDVLEHLPREDVIPALEGFHRLLTSGGILRIRVPNMSCLLATNQMAIDFTHLTNFTEFSLLQVLEAAGFDPDKITLENQAPRLFWSWKSPHRSLFRLLNRCRYHCNNGFHIFLCLLVDSIIPQVFDPNLIVVARK